MSIIRREEEPLSAAHRAEPPPDYRRGILLVSTALVLSGMLADIQTTALVSPLVSAIAVRQHMTITQVGWVVNAGSIGAAVAVSLTGRLGDSYGHRRVLITIVVIAMLGTILTAVAPSFWPIVIGRFFMGSAISVPLAWGMVRPRAAESQVRTVSLILSTVTALFTPCALTLGGAFLVRGLPWQTALWLVFAVLAAVLIVTLFSPETPAASRSRIKVDWAGAIGLGLWVTFMLVALTEGPSSGWGTPVVIGFGAAGVTLFVLWIIQQRLAEVPLMSFDRMDLRQTLIGYSGLGFMGVAGNVLFIGVPNMLQTPAQSGWGLGETPLRSALPLLGSSVAALGAASVVRMLVPRASALEWYWCMPP
jgi:MFS family permease